MLLRRKGASREATLSFLVTTPETGVDSIALTLAFFGPLFAIVRPLAAVATGLVAAFVSLRGRPQEDEAGAEPEPVPEVQGVHRHAGDDRSISRHNGADYISLAWCSLAGSFRGHGCSGVRRGRAHGTALVGSLSIRTLSGRRLLSALGLARARLAEQRVHHRSG